MALKLVTPASALVTLPEIKKHVRAEDFTDDDAYLESLIEVATGHIDGPEGWLGRALGTQEWLLSLDEFPTCDITLPLPPLQSVDELEYTDEDGATQTITDFREFGVGMANWPGRILPAYDTVWPVTRDEPEAVRITFTAGYATVPKPVKHAIMLLVGQWYAVRENATEIKLSEMPKSVDALLMPLRYWPG
jgi:uncharacterized phiE125 gp8 family phage protein